MVGKVFGHDNTVIRGGYSRIYGRLNGVDLVLVPLLGTGLIQPVQCFAPTIAGALRRAGSTATTAFRIGVRRQYRPTGGSRSDLASTILSRHHAVGAGAGEALDPNFRPNVVDSLDFTVQRQLSNKFSLGAWLYRAADYPRVPAYQRQRGTLHDDTWRTDVCQGLCQYDVAVLRRPSRVWPVPAAPQTQRR